MDNPLGRLYTFDFILAVVCAVAWYRAADVEDVPPWYWVGLSAGAYAITWLGLGWGWLGNLSGQAGLLLAVTLFRAWRSEMNTSDGQK